MSSDQINGLFEFIGALSVLLNIRALLRDKMVRGVSPFPVVFFTLWGAFNVYFYPAHGLTWSFYGGLCIAAANIAQIIFMGWFMWQERWRANT